MLEKFIARQPIFDDKLKLFGYELLFRASSENVFRPYKAASEILIVDSTSLFGLQSLTGHAKAFVNLDLLALQRGTARLLPPNQIVLEILESITPTQEVVQLCADLCNEGYTLALDDYVGRSADEVRQALSAVGLGANEVPVWLSVIVHRGMRGRRRDEGSRNRARHCGNALKLAKKQRRL